MASSNSGLVLKNKYQLWNWTLLTLKATLNENMKFFYPYLNVKVGESSGSWMFISFLKVQTKGDIYSEIMITCNKV